MAERNCGAVEVSIVVAILLWAAGIYLTIGFIVAVFMLCLDYTGITNPALFHPHRPWIHGQPRPIIALIFILWVSLLWAKILLED